MISKELLESMSDKILLKHTREFILSKFHKQNKYTETIKSIIKNDNITYKQRQAIINYLSNIY